MKNRNLTWAGQTRLFIALGACCCLFAGGARANDLLDDVVSAYGGADALQSIRQVEFDSAGYFIGRYQSRTTHAPYDRLPVRTFGALDYENEQGVWDSISTWPGELNMGSRSIINGERSLSLNTMARVYAEGNMQSFGGLSNNASLWLTPMLVRQMLENEADVEEGETRTFRHMDYDTLVYRQYTAYIHPVTRMIHAVESAGGAM
ncbi:MAG: hypothetical protein ACX939_12895, partial [Hyphococcus sp.]